MATNFPTSLDTLTNPTASDPQNNPSHSAQHANANDAIEAIETRLGITSAPLPTIIDADGTLAGNSDIKIASQKAVNTFAGNGWVTSGETWTYSSADGATGVFTVTSDVTGKYSPGMRVKYTQSQALSCYWPLDSNSTDSIGAMNGTDTNVTYTAGKFSNAATFNGTTSKIVIADNALLKPTGDFTLGCWFKTNATGVNAVLFQSFSANTNTQGIVLQITPSNVVQLNIGNNAASYSQSLNGKTTITDNSFHHIVASSRNNYTQIYIDGKLDVSGYTSNPVYNATNYIRIGAYNSNGGSDLAFFTGQIDDLFLINGYALDEATIKAKYAAGTAQGTSNITLTKYGIITNVGSFSSTTPITIWGGTDHSTANATISSPYFSSVKAPFGFPLKKNKWTVELSDSVARTQSSPSINVWYNIGSLSFPVPIGIWDVKYQASFYSLSNASQTDTSILSTLSTSNNSQSDVDMTCQLYSSGSSGTIGILSTVFREKLFDFSSKTTMYFNLMTDRTTTASLNLNGSASKLIIRAICNYL